jgi:hypothetical protein
MTLLPGPATGQEDLSGAELDRALAEAMRKPPPPLADWSDPVDPLAEALAREGRWSDAAAFYGRYPPGSREAALALLRLSELTEWESDDFDDLPVLRESLAILAGLGEPDDPDLVYASQAYSAALRQSGLDTDAIIESYRAVLGPDHPLTAQALQAEPAGLHPAGGGTVAVDHDAVAQDGIDGGIAGHEQPVATRARPLDAETGFIKAAGDEASGGLVVLDDQDALAHRRGSSAGR